jgi:hypothetical protein
MTDKKSKLTLDLVHPVKILKKPVNFFLNDVIFILLTKKNYIILN